MSRDGRKNQMTSVWAIILKGQWLNCEDCVPLKKKKKKKKRKRKEKKNKRKEKKKKL